MQKLLWQVTNEGVLINGHPLDKATFQRLEPDFVFPEFGVVEQLFDDGRFISIENGDQRAKDDPDGLLWVKTYIGRLQDYLSAIDDGSDTRGVLPDNEFSVFVGEMNRGRGRDIMLRIINSPTVNPQAFTYLTTVMNHRASTASELYAGIDLVVSTFGEMTPDDVALLREILDDAGFDPDGCLTLRTPL